jgi:hypothetical protein
MVLEYDFRFVNGWRRILRVCMCVCVCVCVCLCLCLRLRLCVEKCTHGHPEVLNRK